MFFDPLYLIIMAPALIFMIYAQIKVKSTYSKYTKVYNQRRITGAQAATQALRSSGLANVPVETVQGKLTDHYDPTKKVLRLSPEVANTPSVAAVGIALHEVGHAVQHQTKYAFMGVRSALVPAANIGSTLGWVFIFVGILLMSLSKAFADFGSLIAIAGILLFAAAVLFTLVTLPVEFNASNRARKMIQESGLLVGAEYDGASAVLSAAALTYVAAMLQAVAQLLYFVLIIFGGRRD
ncbi:MAG: zinc metallopeptidase [Dehalococcoidia bacterium]|nr:zinc metallopeptidase [Dehalococcoidia bacterium]MDD5493575.1 zinc metallopeptidase [Dehalococcoidia bacterium]